MAVSNVPARARNRRITTIAVLVGIGVALYLVAAGLMDWLRATIHGR
jgi:hypothetical protein